MKYLRFDLLVGVDDDVANEAVETDLHDLIENRMIGEIEVPYGIVVSEIIFEKEETKN